MRRVAARRGGGAPTPARACVLLVPALLAIGLGACGSRTDAPSALLPYRASAMCPLKTLAEWQQFLERTAESEKWVETCGDFDNCAEFGSFAEHVETDVTALLDRCASDLADQPALAACTDRLRRFVPAWKAQHSTDGYGFRVRNSDYFASHTGPGEPRGMMELPAGLLAAFPDRARIEGTARAEGWPYLTHDSCLGGARIFIVVGDAADRFDRWMIVNLDDEAKRVMSPTIVSFIAVQKRSATGTALSRVRLHFRDYWVTAATGAWSLSLPENFAGKCYSCHASGMRLLLPHRVSITTSAPVRGEEGFDGAATTPEFALGRLARFNERLLSYGAPDWDDTIRPDDHGPALGRELGCTGCHDGARRGVLTVSTSEGTLAQKMVEQLSMRGTRDGVAVPDEVAMSLLERERRGGSPLSPDEKIALERARSDHERDYAHIVAERFPAWKAWLLARRCDEPPP